jgi:hypothetical protein
MLQQARHPAGFSFEERMAAYNKYQQFVEDLAKKVHNLNSDTLRIALTNTAPNPATHKVLADIGEISAANGYVAGGNVATFSSGAQTSGSYKLILADVTFTAAGGNFNAFQYAVLYNATPTAPLKPLICWFDYGTAITVSNGNSFTVDLDQTGGLFVLA